jgi:hypothetical protein
MDRIGQARIRDTGLVNTREMTSRRQTLPWWQEGRRGKDDTKQNTWAAEKIKYDYKACQRLLLVNAVAAQVRLTNNHLKVTPGFSYI